MNRLAAGVFAVAVSFLLTPRADAHAMLDRATPRVGAVVHAPPTSITLEFSEGVEAALAHVTLSDSHGAAVQLGRASSATSDKRILSVPVKPALTAGTYTVTWRVVSVDSHVTQGDFKFTVRP